MQKRESTVRLRLLIPTERLTFAYSLQTSLVSEQLPTLIQNSLKWKQRLTVPNGFMLKTCFPFRSLEFGQNSSYELWSVIQSLCAYMSHPVIKPRTPRLKRTFLVDNTSHALLCSLRTSCGTPMEDNSWKVATGFLQTSPWHLFIFMILLCIILL